MHLYRIIFFVLIIISLVFKGSLVVSLAAVLQEEEITTLYGYASTTENINPVATNVCGNGIIESTEQCDDENNVDADGCSSICTLEGRPPEAFL